MKIAMGADLYGFPLKESVKAYLKSKDYKITDYGVHETSDPTPYYTTADKVAKSLGKGEHDKAVLVCGTGMGMAIIANKHPGIYAAVCESTFAAEKARSINNSNILTMGSMVTTAAVARDIVDIWLTTRFTEGWDETIQAWLKTSMGEIASIERHQFKK